MRNEFFSNLSHRGKALWAPRLERIQAVRVLAMIEWRKSEGEAAFVARNQTERWEVPFCEVVLSAGE